MHNLKISVVVGLVIVLAGSIIFANGQEKPEKPEVWVGLSAPGGTKLTVSVSGRDEDCDLVRLAVGIYKKEGKEWKFVETVIDKTYPKVCFASEIETIPCTKGAKYRARAKAIDNEGNSAEDWSSAVTCIKKVAFPALTQGGLIALAMLLSTSLAWMIRRRVAHQGSGKDM